MKWCECRITLCYFDLLHYVMSRNFSICWTTLTHYECSMCDKMFHQMIRSSSVSWFFPLSLTNYSAFFAFFMPFFEWNCDIEMMILWLLTIFSSLKLSFSKVFGIQNCFENNQVEKKTFPFIFFEFFSFHRIAWIEFQFKYDIILIQCGYQLSYRRDISF